MRRTLGVIVFATFALGSLIAQTPGLKFIQGLDREATPEYARLQMCHQVCVNDSFLFASAFYGGCVYVLKIDPDTGELSYSDIVDISAELGKTSEPAHMALPAAATNEFLYVSAHAAHDKENGHSHGLRWYSIDSKTGKVAKLGQINCPLMDVICVSPNRKNLYGYAKYDRAINRYSLGADGTPKLEDSIKNQPSLSGRDVQLLISADGKHLYVLSAETRQISIIRLERNGSMTFTGTAALPDDLPAMGSSCLALGLSPDGGHLYACYGGYKADDKSVYQTIALFNCDVMTGALKFKELVPIPEARRINGFLVSPDNDAVFISCAGEGGSDCILWGLRDPATGGLKFGGRVEESTGRKWPQGLAASSDWKYAYAGFWNWGKPQYHIMALKTGVKKTGAKRVLNISSPDVPEFVLDERIKPASSFKIVFNEIDKAKAGGMPFDVEIYTPRNFKLDASFPLVVWFGPVNDDDPTSTRKLRLVLGNDDVIAVAVAPQAPNQHLTTEEVSLILNKVFALFPNIKNKTVGGMGTGAKEILFQLANSDGTFAERFDGFIIGFFDGGPWGALSSLTGKPAAVFYGDHTGNRDSMKNAAAAFQKAGAQTDSIIMAKTGTWPGETDGFSAIRQWIETNVALRGLSDARTAMAAALAANDQPGALRAALRVRAIDFNGKPDAVAADKVIETVAASADQLFNELTSGKPTEKKLKEFVDAYSGVPAAERARILANEFGETEFQALLSKKGHTASNVESFMKKWNGYPVYQKALSRYDEFAQEDLAALLDKTPPASASFARAIARFIERWNETPSALYARDVAEKEAKRRYDECESLPASKQKPKYAQIIKDFPDTETAKTAQKRLKDLEK